MWKTNAASVAVADKLVEDSMSRGRTTAAPTTDAIEKAQSVHEDPPEAPGEESGRVSRPSSQRTHRAGADSNYLPGTPGQISPRMTTPPAITLRRQVRQMTNPSATLPRKRRLSESSEDALVLHVLARLAVSRAGIRRLRPRPPAGRATAAAQVLCRFRP